MPALRPDRKTAGGGEVSLSLPTGERFASAAARMVEEIGQAFGMPPETWRALALASEEVLAYVARHAEADQHIGLICRDGLYRMTVEIGLPTDGFDPRRFNITQAAATGDGLEDLGLLLAARAVDEFAFSREGGRMRLSLHKVRPYPRQEAAAAPPPDDGGDWILTPLSPDRLTQFCRLATASGQAPAFLASPGRVIDMVDAGELDGIVAETVSGLVIGGGLWRRGERIIEFFGPYALPGRNGLEQALVEGCLVAEARGPALGVTCRHPGPGFPAALFEVLGQFALPGGGRRPAYFRQLHEDPGAVVWAVPEIEAFLGGLYRDLGFPRRMLPPEPPGPHFPPHSVLFTHTSREDGIATLRPALPGADCAENIAHHCRHLDATGFPDLRCEIDLGLGWQVGFCPGLLAAGFVPRLVIPHGGERDLLVLQRLTAEGG